MAKERRAIITAADMDKMTPQERADAVDASIVQSWDDVPEPFRTEVQETARRLGEQRRARA
jgi:hypothetical protein